MDLDPTVMFNNSMNFLKRLIRENVNFSYLRFKIYWEIGFWKMLQNFMSARPKNAMTCGVNGTLVTTAGHTVKLE